MKSPFAGGKALLKREKAEFTVRKEKVEIIYHYYLCEDTNERFTNDEIDTINYNQINNKYREKYSFPFPDEIKNIRNKYGLSAGKMAEVLGFGINMYRNYEAGEMPSASNAKLILLAKDPKQFKTLIERSSVFEGKSLEKILKTVNKKIEEERVYYFEMNLKKYLLGNLIPGKYSGYIKPSLKKLTEMVIFFSQELSPWKTSLNKLLFYSDFLNYKRTGYAISGANYRAINLGPVPINFDSIFEYMVNSKDIKIKYHVFETNFGEQFKSFKDRPFNPEIFTETELETLNIIANRFRKIKNTKEIINISHEEKAWLDNEKKKKLIDYKYSFDLIAV
ncbi:MAG: DUF4065 domain-containing protein [Bacteroidales bacterium]|nr:DUF4065 domain-containing protein [Bacteroidales bacterium]